jgi:hypothetical protein
LRQWQALQSLAQGLDALGFKTYIVSNGGVEFMRPMTRAV